MHVFVIFPSWSKEKHVGIVDISSLPTSTLLCTQAGHRLLSTYLSPLRAGLICVPPHQIYFTFLYNKDHKGFGEEK